MIGRHAAGGAECGRTRWRAHSWLAHVVAPAWQIAARRSHRREAAGAPAANPVASLKNATNRPSPENGRRGHVLRWLLRRRAYRTYADQPRRLHDQVAARDVWNPIRRRRQGTDWVAKLIKHYASAVWRYDRVGAGAVGRAAIHTTLPGRVCPADHVPQENIAHAVRGRPSTRSLASLWNTTYRAAARDLAAGRIGIAPAGAAEIPADPGWWCSSSAIPTRALAKTASPSRCSFGYRLWNTTTLVSGMFSGAGGGNADSTCGQGLDASGRLCSCSRAMRATWCWHTNERRLSDIFLRDMVSGTTLLVSVGVWMALCNGACTDPVITPDGLLA